ncbi:MAG TPA: hypothetical protein VMX97_17360, partial [Hyphomicrobiaceae bacterium]|nr:hypothetical protein [Hyphomicrobiaceae bacterium]
HSLAGIAMAVIFPPAAQAHTTDALHPHPHSIDRFAAEGAVTFLLMLAACALIVAARRLLTPKPASLKLRRGQR